MSPLPLPPSALRTSDREAEGEAGEGAGGP